MTLGELLRITRERIDDQVEPHFAPDERLIQHANTAQEEACERGLVLYDTETPEVCQITLTAGEGETELHKSVLAVYRAKLAGDLLCHVQLHDLDRGIHRWEERTGVPRHFVDYGGKIRVHPVPEEDVTIQLEVYRRPLKQLFAEDDVPEIPEEHHVYLTHWMAWEVAATWDIGHYDKSLAERELAMFERRFGKPRSANELRSWHELYRPMGVRRPYFA